MNLSLEEVPLLVVKNNLDSIIYIIYTTEWISDFSQNDAQCVVPPLSIFSTIYSSVTTTVQSKQ